MEGPFHLVYLCGQAKFCSRAARPSLRPPAEENALVGTPALLVFWRCAPVPEPGQQAGRSMFLDGALALRLGFGFRSGDKPPGAGGGVLERLHVVRLRVGRGTSRTHCRGALPVSILRQPEFFLRRRLPWHAGRGLPLSFGACLAERQRQASSVAS